MDDALIRFAAPIVEYLKLRQQMFVVLILLCRMCRPVLHLSSGRMEWIGPMEQQFMEVCLNSCVPCLTPVPSRFFSKSVVCALRSLVRSFWFDVVEMWDL